MEGIFGIVGAIVMIVLINIAIRAVVGTVSAGARAATGGGSFKENMELQFAGMAQFTATLVETTLGEEASTPRVIEFKGKGLIPVTRPTSISFVTSVFDNTDGKLAPVLSALDEFQEETTACYCHKVDAGRPGADQGYASWVRIGVVIPDILEPPFGGSRKFVAIVRMINNELAPNIELGRHDRADGILWTGNFEFSHAYKEKGYQEAAIGRNEARALTVKIAVAIAMADGFMAEDEGREIQRWIKRTISSFSDDRRESLKETYNAALREAYELAKAGNLRLGDLTRRMNEVGERPQKYEAVELCFDVMAADGVASESEIVVIRQIAESMNLDFDIIEKMRDQKIVKLNASAANQASVEQMIGIDPSWQPEQIKRHLRAEFQKWNNRINTLSEGSERANAQRMLDAIAEARKKYG